MGGFVVVSWEPTDAGARAGELIRRAAVQAGLTIAEETQGGWVGVHGPGEPRPQRLTSNCLLIGDVFDAIEPQDGPVPREADDDRVAQWLAHNRWGRYIALFRDGEGRTRSVFRDPSGAWEVFVWRTGVVTVVASGTPDWLVTVAPPRVEIDWERLARFLPAPDTLHGPPALTGLAGPQPGMLYTLADGVETYVWDPVRIASAPISDAREAVEGLEARLDHCVGALCGSGRGLAAELSGGLDSAIVASSLRRRGVSPDLWLNTFTFRPETDERTWAALAADYYRADLTTLERPDVPFDAEVFERTAGHPRPSQNGRDVANDIAVAEICAARGMTALVTGKGGDALFFQMHTPLAFADLWRIRGARSALSPFLPAVARWTRTSVWSVIDAARRAERNDRSEGMPTALGPAKRLQIRAIRDGLAYISSCRRSEVVDMIHPLTAQPLVEWMLRTPVPMLVEGGRDRALARRAFADRIPPLTRERVGKGDYAAYFNRQVARNLPFLRDYLLDGRLAAKEIFDREGMAASLNEDALRWAGNATAILAAVSLEAWARRWEARGGR